MGLDELHQGVLDHLELLVRQGKSVDGAAETLVRIGVERAVVGAVVEYRTELARSQRERTLDDRALFDPEVVGLPWYTGPGEHDVFWPRLRATLSADPGWADAVDSLDAASTNVVGLLRDPHSPQIRTRGLVIGHVQSGKTANFTATIAKAADAGYRMFIVLSGVHNALRRQTQIRLDRHLHDLEPTRWLTLTDEYQDFGNPVKALALVAGTELRLLAVVKKNAPRLRRLRDWLRAADEHGGFDTCPVLIIDDEADQASPNAARNADLDRTKINELIVDILALPRVAYVGYTATPFANILIDPSSPRDLYPRHFIYALPKPSSYFGAEELFGLGRTEDEGYAPHDMIRLVPDDEADRHKVRAGQSAEPELTPSLQDALRWFVLATAARRIRSGARAHSSMLVHTTQRVAMHFEYQPLIRDGIRQLRASVQRGDVDVLRTLWNDETAREPAERHGLEPVPFDSLAVELQSVLDDVKVVVDNGQSPDRLLYDDSAATTVIAVGGNTLSRGLTLEGLVSSYFLRGANAYDTLLQMGRWFGYRPGYGDLPRIWTTAELVDAFRHLADVERDIRSEVERYAVEQTTPEDVEVRIRLHPRMKVTAGLKMQFAVPVSSSFSGQRPQTILFRHRDQPTVDSNLRAARELVGSALAAVASVETGSNRIILRDVGANAVAEFLRSYQFHPDSEITSKQLLDYIGNQNEHFQLLTWNVAVVTREFDSRGTIDLGLSQPVNLIERSKLHPSRDPSTANIGTLMSKPDMVADVMEAPEAAAKPHAELVEQRTASGRALLVLYPITANSEPRTRSDGGGNQRRPLNAVGDLIGVALAFPRAPSETDPASKVAVDLTRVRPLLEERNEGDLDQEYHDEDGDRNNVDLDTDA